MAFFVKCFESSEYWAMTLWSSLSYLILIGAVFYFLKDIFDKKMLWWTMAFLAFNPMLLRLSADIAPDLVMCAFAFPAILLLWKVQLKEGFLIAKGILFSCLLFIAFCTKLTVLFILPFLSIIFFWNILNKKKIRFWLSAFVTGFVLLACYFLIYDSFTGDPFFRFNGLELTHSEMQQGVRWNYVNRPFQDYLLRLTIKPIGFFLNAPGYAILLIPIALYFIIKAANFPKFFKINKSNFPGFLGLYFATTLLMHWFCSTSLNYYNPVVLVERMLILILPAITILCIYIIQKKIPQLIDNQNKWFLDLSSLLTLLCIAAFFLFEMQYNGFLWSFYIGIVFVFVGIFKIQSTKILIHCFLPFVVIQIQTIINYKNAPFFQEQSFFEALPKNEKVLVFTDSELAEKYDLYFQFKKPENLQVIDWRNRQAFVFGDFDNVYLLVNFGRLEMVKSALFQEVPEWIEQDNIGVLMSRNDYLESWRLK